MLFASDDDDSPLKCARCLKEFHEKVGRLKAGEGAICPDPACQTRIEYSAEQFGRLLKEARERPHDFFRKFVRLRAPD
jgi:hypothetical protein